MSINKKLMLLIMAIIIFPMLALFYISGFVLNKQINSGAQGYLENALKIAENEIQNRKREMQKGAQFLANSPEFHRVIELRDRAIIEEKLLELKEVYDYLDFIILIDSEFNKIAEFPMLNSASVDEVEGLIQASNQSSTFSPLTISLDQFFLPDSQEYHSFRVLGTDIYLQKALAGVAVVPIRLEEKNNYLAGYLLVGDIVNNDDYFPEIYSRHVRDSYLAISIDGIRIASNIRSPLQEDFVGSIIPFEMKYLTSPDDLYFGRVNIDDEIHVFLDKPLLDYNQNLIGAIGVGIPEHMFSILLDTNQNIILIVTLPSLFLMLIVGRIMSSRITKPIIEATEIAEQIANNGRRAIYTNYSYEDGDSETDILLRTFRKMAHDLQVSEEEGKRYLQELEVKHHQQLKLTEQLKLLNDELEEKVEARTRDLREAIIVLKKADEVKTRFLANMSHELRTPLNGIICTADALKDKIFGTLNEKQEKYIQNILYNSNHLLQLINDILDLTKIEAGKMTLNLGKYSISDIILDSFLIVKSLAYRKNIEVSIKIMPSDFQIEVDAKKLKQILYNLLSNAIKFTPDGGKVAIEAYKLEGYIQIAVKDNGIGIKEEHQERIFNEFEQVDNSYERHYEGTGLGLPLTKKLIELHGGEIFLASKFGEGTEVLFTLPILIE